MITTEQVKSLRDKTGISVMQCRKALEEAIGDESKAIDLLKQGGAAIAAKKSGRTLGSATIASYVHNTGKIGVMVSLFSETDFVSGSPEFKEIARDIAMHVAASGTTDMPTLLLEPFVKDPSKTVGDLITAAIQKFGERIELGAVSRLDA